MNGKVCGRQEMPLKRENLGALAYNVKRTLENQAKKVQLRLGGEQARDRMQDWKAVNSMDNTRTSQLIINSTDKLWSLAIWWMCTGKNLVLSGTYNLN